jgi:hypothetical protein
MQKHYRVVVALLWITVCGTAQNWSWGIKATGNHQMSGDMEITGKEGKKYEKVI